jgi:hypothetical protein
LVEPDDNSMYDARNMLKLSSAIKSLQGEVK